MIIVEGPDGGGKTTTVQFIQAAYPQYKVIHSPGPLENDAQLRERLFWNDEMCGIPNIILDRSTYFSEYIYGPILRDGSMVSYEVIIQFLMRFQKFPCNLLVYCSQAFTHKEATTDIDKEVNKKIDFIREDYLAFFTRLSSDHQHFKFHQVHSTLDIIPLIERIGVINEYK